MRRAVRSWFRSAADVQRGEVLPAGLMFLYGFLALTSYYLVKPVRNSVFVDRVGAENLPYVYILTALFVTALVWVYSRWVDRVRERTLLLGTFALLAVSLVIFWRLLLTGDSVWVSGSFFVWGKLYPLLLVSQFWLVGNLLFTTRQAKRLFPPIGVGLVLGGIAGSGIAGTAASALGSGRLLLVAAALLAACAAIVLFLAPRLEGRDGPGVRLAEEISGDALRILRRSPHLRTVAGILAVTILVGTLVDWQLNRAVELAIEGEDAKTAFYGRFFLGLNLVSVTVQALFTGWVLRRFGVGFALLVLPVGLLAASLGILLVPVLLTAALAKGTEGALRYSLDQSTRELLFLPISPEDKVKVKPLIDLAVYRGGTGLGGLVLLVLVNGLGVGLRGVAVASLVIVLGWIGLTLAMRRRYVESLARSFRGRFASPEGAIATLTNASALPLVQEALGDGDPLRAAFALDLVDRAPPGEARRLSGQVAALTEHPSAALRARALEVLGRMPGSGDPERLRAGLRDPEPAVREAAARALLGQGGVGREEAARRLLTAGDRRVRLAALSQLARQDSDPGPPLLGREVLDGLAREAGPGGPDARLELALATALVEEERAVAILPPLLADPDPRVASAALRSAGRIDAPELLPRLVEALGNPATRSAARDALASRGERAIPALAERLRADGPGDPVRLHIPAAVGQIPCQAAVDVLLDIVGGEERDERARRRALKALGGLRARHPELALRASRVQAALAREVRGASRYAAAIACLEKDGTGEAGRAQALLRRALAEAWAERREGAFRALGLVFPPEDVYRCYLALVAGDERSRANALEWLEQAVGRSTFAGLEPVLRREPAAPLPPALRRARPEVLRSLWGDPDRWVARCAVRAAAELPWHGLETELRSLRASHPELAAAAGRPIDGPPGRRGEEAEMDPIEKVFLLQKVDLLRGARSGHLALLASIAREVEAEAGTLLIRKGEPTDALYIVLRGSVELEGVEGATLVAEQGTPFGTWALIDEEPSLVAARAATPARLLRISRQEFYDLLSDHPDLAGELLRGLARRVRTLVADLTESPE